VTGTQAGGEQASPQRSWYLQSLSSREHQQDPDHGQLPASSMFGNTTKSSSIPGNTIKSPTKSFRRPARSRSHCSLPVDVTLPPTPVNETRSADDKADAEISFDTPTPPAPSGEGGKEDSPEVLPASFAGARREDDQEELAKEQEQQDAQGVQGSVPMVEDGQEEKDGDPAQLQSESQGSQDPDEQPGILEQPVVIGVGGAEECRGDSAAVDSEDWVCKVDEPEQPAPDDVERGQGARTGQSRAFCDFPEALNTDGEGSGTSRHVHTEGKEGVGALRQSFAHGPLAWISVASAALLDFSERLPELLTPAHLLRYRKLRPEVKALFMGGS